MEVLILIMSIHFALGAAGILLTGRNLTRAERKKDWLKYFSYLLIFFMVMSAALAGRAFMTAVSITIYSAGLFELLIVSKGKCNEASREKTIAIAISTYLVLAVLFSVFLFLPMKLIIFTYILVVIFDGASQITGRYWGKHKIAPVISPFKTVEGLAGGVMSSVPTGLILHGYAGLSLTEAFLISLIVCLSAFTGDLAASAFKRAFNVKDYGTILPGQGGVLDRFDSFIFTGALMGPAGYFIAGITDINRNLAAYLGYSLGFIIILFAAEAIKAVFRIRSEYSRIISHTVIGFMCIFMTELFSSGIYLIVFCIQSAIFIHFSSKLKVLNGINGVRRNTYGGTYFFIGIIIAYVISEMLNEKSFFILPVLVMTICDPAASITGMSAGGRHNRFGKTIAGSAAFLITAAGILFSGVIFYLHMNSASALVMAISLAVASALAEYLSGSGLDNITVPAVVSAGMMILRGIL